MGNQAHTFLFADIVGFTSLTATHGDEAAADLAVRFADHVTLRATEHGAQVVKTLGDAVMVRGADAAATVELALRLQDDRSELGFPGIHVGVNTGPAVSRGGDWFGTTVNLASRVADSARASEVLVTENTLAACGELGDVDVRSLGPQLFKNMLAATVVYAAERRERPQADTGREGRFLRLEPAMMPA